MDRFRCSGRERNFVTATIHSIIAMRLPHLFALLLFTPSIVDGATLIDVEILPGPIAGGPAVEASQQLSQSFTTTLPGQLVRIDLPLGRIGGGSDFAVSVYTVTSGHADLTRPALFSQTYSLGILPLNPLGSVTGEFTSFDVASAGIQVETGVILGILVSRTAGATDLVSEWILWRGAGGNMYSGGEHQVYRPMSNSWSPQNGTDQAFRTYVTEVPEPSSLALLAVAAVGLASRRNHKTL